MKLPVLDGATMLRNAENMKLSVLGGVTVLR